MGQVEHNGGAEGGGGLHVAWEMLRYGSFEKDAVGVSNEKL